MSIKVTVPNSSGDYLTFGSANTPTAAQIGGYDDGSGNGHLELYTTASGVSTEQMRITSAGNVGFGTSSPSSVARASFGNSSASGQNKWAAYFGTNSDTASAAPNFGLTIGWNRSGGGGESNIVYGTSLGSSSGLAFSSSDGTTVTERARIDSSGNLLVGTTSATGTSVGTGVQIIPNLSGLIGLINIGHVSSGSGNPYHQFYYNNGMIGSITQNGTTGVLYNLTSDYRLKNNPVPVTGAKDFVMALQPKTWDWWDGSGKGVGFIAHEFMEVAKYSGNGIKDAVDADGKPVYQSIQPSSSEVMANLVSLIQEQQAIITEQSLALQDLKASITSLEARIETLEGAKA